MAFSRSRTRKTALLTGMLAISAICSAAPASAHDALASSSPADGEIITTDPGEVSITLTNPPTTVIDGANILTVTAPDGHVVSNGVITADGPTLSTDAAIEHEGEHTVVWRVVSADGHPIEGSFSFTYAPETAPPAASPSTSPTATDTATAAPESSTADPAPEGVDAASETESGNSTGWLIGAGVIIVALVIGLIYFARRSNKA